MKKVTVFAVEFVLAICTSAFAYDDGDFQIWHTEDQEFKINSDSKIALQEEFRFADNANEFFYHHYDVGLQKAFNKNLDLALSYRHIYEKKKGKFRIENEPSLNAAVKWQLWGLDLSDKNRLEYRHFDYQADSLRYRNTFRASLSIKVGKLNLAPYLADEIFLSSSEAVFNNNRFYSGIGLGLSKNIKAEVYYMLQHTRTVNKNSTDWPRTNVFGSKFKIAF